MKPVLIDLFTSKKFLAAIAAIAICVAGRVGLALDPATLDRIIAAILAYIVGQGIADNGKSAALIARAAVVPANENAVAAAARRADAAPFGALALVVLALAGASALPACTGAQRANGLAAGLDCTAPARAAVVADLGVTFEAWVLKHVASDGRTIQLAQLKRDAAALKGEAIGSCAIIAALAALAHPAVVARSLAPGPDPAAWGDALTEVRLELGVAP